MATDEVTRLTEMVERLVGYNRQLQEALREADGITPDRADVLRKIVTREGATKAISLDEAIARMIIIHRAPFSRRGVPLIWSCNARQQDLVRPVVTAECTSIWYSLQLVSDTSVDDLSFGDVQGGSTEPFSKGVIHPTVLTRYCNQHDYCIDSTMLYAAVGRWVEQQRAENWIGKHVSAKPSTQPHSSNKEFDNGGI